MTHSDTQLKQALAKMLPEKLHIVSNAQSSRLYWTGDCVADKKVLDTELLHLCWLVEETMRPIAGGKTRYEIYLEEQVALDSTFSLSEHKQYRIAHATWQQRTIALAKVKGVEIV